MILPLLVCCKAGGKGNILFKSNKMVRTNNEFLMFFFKFFMLFRFPETDKLDSVLASIGAREEKYWPC